MSELTVAVAAGCVVQIAEATFAPRGAGMVEDLHLEVVADPSCPWIELSLPRGAVLGDARARQRLGDGSRARLGPERWEPLPRSIHGRGAVRLHVPELVSGDRVVVDVERWVLGPVDWRPGPARYAAVEVRGGALTLAPLAGGEPDGRRSIWTSDAGAEWGARIGGVEPLEPLPERVAAGDVRIEERLTLHVPPGNAQVALYPGGGSSVTIQRFLTFPGADAARAWPIDAPPGAGIALTATPEGAAALERDPTLAGPGPARILVAPGEAPVRVAVQWTRPDAPIHGERAPEVESLAVDAPNGVVRWEGAGWWLLAVNEQLVMPNREVLVRALDRRFRRAAIPEPGAPMELRGRPVDWTLVADLRPALLERVAIGRWPHDPLWVRKLVRARKQGALTPTEAALTLWMYARQLHVDADWALVRPAPAGPGTETVPTGIGEALVRVTLGGETRWIDPTCGVCAPFELPPELEGATALGPGIAETPPPTAGRHEVRVGPTEVTWSLEGPPALLLRRWLAGWPADERTRRLAERIGGPGARLLELDGVERAGEPILARATRSPGAVVETPLATPPADPSGTVWVDWIGERRVVWAGAEAVDAEVAGEVTTWRREGDGDGGVVETLVVRDRRIPAAEIAAIDEARAAAERPPSPEEPAEPVPAEPAPAETLAPEAVEPVEPGAGP